MRRCLNSHTIPFGALTMNSKSNEMKLFWKFRNCPLKIGKIEFPFSMTTSINWYTKFQFSTNSSLTEIERLLITICSHLRYRARMCSNWKCSSINFLGFLFVRHPRWHVISVVYCWPRAKRINSIKCENKFLYRFLYIYTK